MPRVCSTMRRPLPQYLAKIEIPWKFSALYNVAVRFASRWLIQCILEGWQAGGAAAGVAVASGPHCASAKDLLKSETRNDNERHYRPSVCSPAPPTSAPAPEAKARPWEMPTAISPEIFERVGGKGSNADLPGSIQRQQGNQW
jgi:hypothetical protein